MNQITRLALTLLVNLIGLSAFSLELTIQINADTLRITQDRVLAIPLTLTPLTERNIIFFDCNRKSKCSSMNIDLGPVHVFFQKEYEIKNSRRLWKRFVHRIRYGSNTRVMISSLKIKPASKKVCSELLPEDGTNFILKLKLSKKLIRQIDAGDIPLKIVYGLSFHIDDLVSFVFSDAPYRVVRKINYGNLDRDRIITGSAVSNGVTILLHE
jgi:hypothetical protein